MNIKASLIMIIKALFPNYYRLARDKVCIFPHSHSRLAPQYKDLYGTRLLCIMLCIINSSENMDIGQSYLDSVDLIALTQYTSHVYYMLGCLADELNQHHILWTF